MISNRMDIYIKKSKILIVDNKTFEIDLLVGVLEDEGYCEVFSILDLSKIIPLCKSNSVDLILLSFDKPYLKSFKVMQSLRKTGCNLQVPVIILSSNLDRNTRQIFLREGAKDSVLMPFCKVDLLHRIYNILETYHFNKNSCNWINNDADLYKH